MTLDELLIELLGTRGRDFTVDELKQVEELLSCLDQNLRVKRVLAEVVQMRLQLEGKSN
jgi:hypothetical protein